MKTLDLRSPLDCTLRRDDPVLWFALERYGLDQDALSRLGPFDQQNVGGLGGPWRPKSGSEPACTTVYAGLGHKGDTMYWYGWPDLFSIPNVSYRRILHLVNYFRDNGVELPWFADFDQCSARWTALEGQYRAQPA